MIEKQLSFERLSGLSQEDNDRLMRNTKRVADSITGNCEEVINAKEDGLMSLLFLLLRSQQKLLLELYLKNGYSEEGFRHLSKEAAEDVGENVEKCKKFIRDGANFMKIMSWFDELEKQKEGKGDDEGKV